MKNEISTKLALLIVITILCLAAIGSTTMLISQHMYQQEFIACLDHHGASLGKDKCEVHPPVVIQHEVQRSSSFDFKGLLKKELRNGAKRSAD